MENLILIGKSREDFFDLMDEYHEARRQKPLVNKAKPVSAPEQDEKFLTQKETARFLRVSLPTLIRMKKDGKIPFYQSRRTVLFKKSEILEALRNQ